MAKEIIAVDLDDVLADHAASFIRFSNSRYGTDLALEDYDERWDRLWNINDWDEILRRADEFHTPQSAHTYELIEGAQPALEKLGRNYTLAIVTARPKVMIGATHGWLKQHFSGVFEEVHFVPIWEPDNKLTKADICRQINAQYLIDDVVKHCNLAAEVGITALLFGDFAWHKSEKIREDVVRVEDWPAVLEYFDGRD